MTLKKAENLTSKTGVSAGVILAIMSPSGPEVVLMKQDNAHYERPSGYGEVIDIGPKGGIEDGEAPIDTALREAKEETGLSGLSLDTGFKAEVEYEFDQPTGDGHTFHMKKKVIYYLAYITEEDVKRIRPSDEHESFEILPINQAMGRIERTATTKIDVLKKLKAYLSARPHG